MKHTDSVIIIAFVVLIIFFAGDPDIHDAVIEFLTRPPPEAE